MRKSRQGPLLASLCIAASLFLPTLTATAAESVPELQYPAIPVGRHETMVSGPNGSVTLACSATSPGVDLATYDNTSTVARKLDRTQMIDGVPNCITKPVVDKNGTLYGIPYGKMANGVSTWGPNLLAYSGNDLKWKYPVSCGSNSIPVTVGANGNIYTTQYMSDGVHLIGLTPEVASGQTQPAKVLDIKIANDCSVEFFPYRDGLLVRGQNSGFKYYSYAGKLLAQPQVNRFWDARLGANGGLFDYKLVSGSFTSTSVSMYDPLTGQMAWTTSASTPGANVQATSLFPLPGGGVAALIKEQKMASDGIPATPATYISTLAILNSAGQKVSSIEVPSASAGNMSYNHRIVSSDNGKLVIVSDAELRPSYASAISIRVFDIATGSWAYQQLMSGDLSKPGGPSGFYTDRGPAIGDNNLFLIGQCSGNCSVYQEKKLYAVKAPVGLGVDYPRGAVLEANTPEQPAPVPYVALGDSYSSGDGVVPFESGTDTPSNQCHRSELSYGKLTSRNPRLAASLSLGKFAACGGAETTQILNDSANGERAQYKWLNSDTRLVTLSIGGNDIGFITYGIACIVDNCNIDSAAYYSAIQKIENELPHKLEATYRKLLETGVNAQILVLGYPQLAPIKAEWEPVDPRCPYLYSSGEGDKRPWKDAQGARMLVDRLNTQIKTVVDRIREIKPDFQRLRYIEVNGIDSPFYGHTICSSESYFNNLDQAVGHPSYALHPNARGQQAYADLVTRELQQ